MEMNLDMSTKFFLSYNMRTILLFLFVTFGSCLLIAQERRAEVTFKTNAGTIVVALYNETPKHRDNFIRNVDNKVYDGLLFHRVIKDFMIQGGDPKSRNAAPGVHLGDGEVGEPIDAEFCFPKLFHKRGALAAAREGDDTNPERKSSSSQFYIVWGKDFTDYDIERVQARLDSCSGGTIKLTPEVIDHYKMFGGTPHLDGTYTVFGEVVKGLEVIYRIQQCPTDEHNRPVDDAIIKKAKVTKRL